MKSVKYIFPVILMALFIHCKKDNGKQSSTCNIRLINNFGKVYAYTFDNQGRVLTMFTDADPEWNAKYTYAYTNDSCILTATRNNKLWKKTTAVLNAGGQPISSITSEYNYYSNNPIPVPYADSVLITYEYDNDANLVKMTSKKDNMPAEINSYTWLNGNMVSDSRGVTYTYHTDRPAQDGDFFSFQELWPDVSDANPRLVFKKNKNLLKSAGGGSNEVAFKYEINTEGNIVVINHAIIIGYTCR